MRSSRLPVGKKLYREVFTLDGVQVGADTTFITADITGKGPAAASQQNGANGHSEAHARGTAGQQPQPQAAGSPESTDAPTEDEPSAILVRRRSGDGHLPLELRVAVIGNVDSGKSTMVGVLTRSMLDNGRGAARSKVFKHSHEGESGRTSAIGQHNLCLDSKARPTASTATDSH